MLVLPEGRKTLMLTVCQASARLLEDILSQNTLKGSLWPPQTHVIMHTCAHAMPTDAPTQKETHT